MYTIVDMEKAATKYLKYWRLLLFLIGISVVGWILYQYYAPDGTLVLEYDFVQKPTLISEFFPVGRALDREMNTSNDEHYQRIVSEPVYFSVDLPSAYPEVEVSIEYQNPHQQIVQLGLQLDDDDTTWNFDFKTLENQFIDNSSWNEVSDDTYTLLQKDNDYTSIEDFFNNPPTDKRVGTWLTTFNFPFINKTYQSIENGTSITNPLRGAHDFFTYVKDEDLKINFVFEDINYSIGPDPVTIEVIYLGEVIETISYEDDGDEGITGVSLGEQFAEINIPKLPEGVYEIAVRTSDDIVIKTVKTNQHKFVVKGKMHLAGSKEYLSTISNLDTKPSTIYTDADFVTLIPKHIYGLSDVSFYNEDVTLSKVNAPHNWFNPISNYLSSIVAPNNDVEILSNDFYSTSKDSWFDPMFGFQQLSQYTNLDNLDYVLTGKYNYPERQRSWTTASATFDLIQQQRIDPTHLDFVFSVPGLEDSQQGIKVRKITIVTKKPAVTISNFWQRLKDKVF